MSQIVHRHRAFIARGMAVMLMVLVALLAIPFSTPNFADDPPPPPEDYQVTESADMDGDNQPDKITSAPAGEDENSPDPGEVYVRSSEGGDVVLRGGEPDDWFGSAVADVGDLNDDGFRDLLVGAPKMNNRAGLAYVFYGPFRDYENPELNPSDADMVFENPEPGDYEFGTMVGPVIDIDCDGIPDLRIASKRDDPNGEIVIHTYFASGATGAPLYRATDSDPFDSWYEVPGDAEGDGDVDDYDTAIINAISAVLVPI